MLTLFRTSVLNMDHVLKTNFSSFFFLAIFDPLSYSKEIFENIAVGSSVLTVSATDADSGRIIKQM